MLKEETWQTYSLKIEFNSIKVEKVTITEHYQEKHSKVINDELILKILENNLNGKRITPDLSYLKKDIFVWTTNFQEKNYRLIFWYDNEDKSILWIKNCYRKN